MHRSILLTCSLLLASSSFAQTFFSSAKPLLGAGGEVLNPPLERIDVNKHRAGHIPDLEPSDWTVAIWNFPAWNPGGKHWPELADQKPLCIPLLYDSEDPDVRYRGTPYYRQSDPRVMDWHVKWMRDAGINLVMFDWYPSESKEAFDNSPRHRHINDSIEVGFLRKPYTGADPVATNPYAKKMNFVAMWTNHGNAWIPKGTMEYACENFMNQPNYYRVDGKPLVIIHAPGHLRDEHGGEGSNDEKMERLREWVLEQRAIAKSYGHDEIFLALGSIAPEHSKGFIKIGFDAATNYVTHALPEFSNKRPIVKQLKKGTREGVIIEADYETQLMPSMRQHWDKMYAVWGADGFFPTVTQREDWRHWHPQSRMYHYHSGNPDLYAQAIQEAKDAVERHDGRKFITVGIWNEFYEGAYLEPDLKYGFEYLRAIHSVFGTGTQQ